MKREYRKAHIESRADGDRPGVTLKVIAPGVVDDYGSVWDPGVFAESIAKRMPTLVWAHDWSEPLGPATGTRTAPDGTPVIDFDFSDFDAVPMARRAHAQVSDGTIADCSVGFSNAQRRPLTSDEQQRWPGGREVITRATLDEVSLVLAGAVPGAKVASIRSAGGGAVSLDAVVELAKRVAAGDMTNAEAKAAIDLLTDEPPPGGDEPPPPPPSGEDPAIAEAAMDADIDAALELAVGRSKR